MTRPTGTTTSATFLATPSPSARDNLRDVSMQDPSRPEMSSTAAMSVAAGE